MTKATTLPVITGSTTGASVPVPVCHVAPRLLARPIILHLRMIGRMAEGGQVLGVGARNWVSSDLLGSR